MGHKMTRRHMISRREEGTGTTVKSVTRFKYKIPKRLRWPDYKWRATIPAWVTKSLPNSLPQIHSHGSNPVWSIIVKTTKTTPPPPLDQSGGGWFWESLEKAKQTQDLTNGLLAHLVLVVTSSLWNAVSLLFVAFLLPLPILPLPGLLHGRTTNMAKALKIILKWLFERTNIINEKKICLNLSSRTITSAGKESLVNLLSVLKCRGPCLAEYSLQPTGDLSASCDYSQRNLTWNLIKENISFKL